MPATAGASFFNLRILLCRSFSSYSTSIVVRSPTSSAYLLLILIVLLPSLVDVVVGVGSVLCLSLFGGSFYSLLGI